MLRVVVVFLLVASFAYAYEGCGADREKALMNLSGNIKSKIGHQYTEEMNSVDGDDVETKISSYINESTNLTLVKISYTKKADQICASVKHDDQAKNTRQLLNKALTYKQSNLPTDINEKIKTLEIWLDDIEQLNYLIPVFLEDVTLEQNILAEKEKAFKDLYSDAIKHSNSLVWRTCKASKEEAKSALNKLLFVDNGKKEDEGFWASIASVFSTTQDKEDIDLFDEQISYIDKDSKKCAMIKKDDLLHVAIKMNNDAKRFSKKSLAKDHIKRYEQIQNYIKEFSITKKLISLYPDNFKSSDFNNLNRAFEILNKAKETTYPQYVMFNIKSKTDIKIKLDDKFVKNNEKMYIKVGEHSYKIEAKDRCAIEGTFSIEFKENEVIEKDFSQYTYPSVIFLTDKSASIAVDGNMFSPNKKQSIKKCSDEPLRYIAKFEGQTKEGEIDISANAKNTINLKFLSAEEMAVFNDAKTKNFTTTTYTKISESLTPITSKNLEFSISSDVSHGKLELHERGSFKYISDKDFVGIDSFEYTITALGETSPPKVVNIRVENSNAPVAAKKEDNNSTKKEEKTQQNKEKTVDEQQEEKYKRFKDYAEKLEEEKNVEKLQKLQEKYPDMFNRLIKEKTSGM
jgi:disulfide oxidoreductase YuzD